MSRWLKNVGNFLDQLDTQAADVVTSAVAGRDVNLEDDDDDDDKEEIDGYHYTTGTGTSDQNNNNDNNNVNNNNNITGSNDDTNLQSLLYEYPPTNTRSASTEGHNYTDSHSILPVRDLKTTFTTNHGEHVLFLNESKPPSVDSRARVVPLSHAPSVVGEGDLNTKSNSSTTTIDNNNNKYTNSFAPMDVSSSNLEHDNHEGWNNDDDDDMEDITERSKLSDVATSDVNVNKDQVEQNTLDTDVPTETPKMIPNEVKDVDETRHHAEATSTSSTPMPLVTTINTPSSNNTSDAIISVDTEISNNGSDNEPWIERTVVLEQQLQQYQIQFQHMQKEKQNEIHIVTKEARTLRRHLATINEQLAAADREVGAQRQELENAAQRLEKDQARYKLDIQALQTKHSHDVQQMKQQHQEAMANIQVQSQNQVNALKKEIADIRQQRQQEGGDWNKELSDAIQREQMVRLECQALIDERDTLLGQIDTLRSQQESLGSRLESLTAIADNAAVREREAEVQLDNAMTLHAKQLSQRQTREAELERTVSELSALLVVERSKQTNAMTMHEKTLSSSSGDMLTSVQGTDDAAAIEVIEGMKLQLEIERHQNASLQKEIADVVRERQEEALLTQTRQAQNETKISDLTQQVFELRATIRDVKQQETMALQQRQTDDSKFDLQNRIQELSEELVRMRERMSVSNSEVAALRNRLQAALNRAVVAEAAAESAFQNTSDLHTWSNHPNDPEQGLTVRRRGTNPRSKGSSDVPTIRKALRLDNGPGSGIGSNTQSLGKGLDVLDGFLAQSGEILRFNAIARLCFGKISKNGVFIYISQRDVRSY